MKKKLVLSVMVILVVASVIAGGAFAAFLDVETSTNNTFTAGTLDLKTNDADGVTQTLYATNMKPGDTVGPQTITLKNSGSIDGATLDIDVSYVESDGTNPPEFPVNKTADEFADELIVDTLSYGGTNLLLLVTDTDGDGIDMKEVAVTDFSGQAGINAGLTKDFIIQVTLKDTIGNDFQADGIDVTITFTLNQ